jgi:molecular chaperone Hsp33
MMFLAMSPSIQFLSRSNICCNAFSTIHRQSNLYHSAHSAMSHKRSLSLKRSFQGFNDRTMTVILSSSAQEGSNDANDYDHTWEPFLNKSNIRDQVLTCISENGEMKVTAATYRNIVNEFMMQHTLTSVSADALGRAVGCALLLSNGMKDQQTFQLTVNGDGPIRGILAISNGLGHVRGYVGTPQLGPISLPEAVGKGTIQVVKNHPDWPRPYNGITAIQNGDIDRDVGLYLAESEQRSCALAAATTIHGILCTSAGGYIVEQLPGCSEETIHMVERNLNNLVIQDGTDQLPTGILTKGGTPFDICRMILDGLDMKPLQQLEPKVICECNEERLLRAVRLLPKEEVDEIMTSVGKLEARCHFCGKVYRWGPDELEKRLSQAKGNPSLEESNFE